MVIEMAKAIDTDDNMAIDNAECMALEGKDADICMMIVEGCDANGDGEVDGCEFFACLDMVGEEYGCIS